MERRFGRDYSALEEIFGFISEFLAEEGIDGADGLAINLIIEELFTNLVKYNVDGKFPVFIRLTRDGDQVAIELTDYQVTTFDVTQVPEADIDRLLNERRGGGLGIHLVRKLADDFSYEHVDGNSTIRVTRRLER